MWPWPRHLFESDDLRSADPQRRTGNWRERQLLRVGFEPELAARTAADREVDLHALIELVENGCPARLAVRILAPLDGEKGPLEG